MNREDENVPPAKKARGVNYTKAEKEALLNFVVQEKHIIECKKTDSVTWRDKEAAWARITNLFNSVSPGQTYRSTDSLKKLYDNQKKKVRQEYAKERASVVQTGGGSGYFVKDAAAELTLSLMNKKTIGGLSNTFDSNNNQNRVSEEEEKGESNTTMINDNENSNVKHQNWANCTPAALKTPASSQLANTSKSWHSRRRPVSSTLTSSDITKNYSDLSAAKLEIANLELQLLKKKEEQENELQELHKQSLELDVQIKKAILSRINSISTDDIFRHFCK